MCWCFGHRVPAWGMLSTGGAGLVLGNSVWSPWGFARGWWCWNRPGWAEVAVRPCHVRVVIWDLRAQGLALPLGSRSRSGSKGGSHVAHSGSHPAGKGIQCMGVTWPSTWGLSHPELDPQAQKGRGKAAEKGVSRVVPRALLRSHFSHVPTDTWMPCKTLPRKIHSYNPTTPFLPSLLLHGVFPRGSW